jgi:hypothetical protein
MRTCGRECCQLAFALFLFVGLSANLRAQTNQTVPGCRDVAPTPPVLAFVGPGTTPAGANEVGIGAGAWGNLFPPPCAHETGEDWFGRWNRGLTDRLDLGVDFQGSEHSSYQTLSAMIAARYELVKNLRLEAGIGSGDDTEGKSLTGEVGATVGIPKWKPNWAPYASVRLAAAHGYAGRAFVNYSVPPGALVPMASFGASARVGENMRWVFEGGAGGVVSRQHPAIGTFVFIAVGLDFVLPKRGKAIPKACHSPASR